MKKYFYIQETVKYNHRIEIEIDESQEEHFEEYAEQVAEDVNSNGFDSKESIFNTFADEFGDDSVNFVEDGLPDVEYESY
jgi:hypothetical protein